MTKTTTPTGRLKLETPDYHYDVDDDYGLALFNTLTSAWEHLSDNIGTRWFSQQTVAVGALLSFDHNFGLHLTKLMLYYHQDGSQLTKAEAAAKFSAYYVNTDTITIESLSSVEETFDLTILSWKFDNDSQIDLDALERLTANRALKSGSGGGIEASDVTATELGYLDGASSNIQLQINMLTSANVDSNELTGFYDTIVPLAYDADTRICTVGDGNPFLLWLAGTRYTRTSDTAQATASDGDHFFVYDVSAAGSLSVSQTVFDFSSEAQVLYVRANAACSPTSYAVRETHGLMPWQAHLQMHEAEGTYRGTGFVFTGYTVDSTTAPNSDNPTDAENTFAISSGIPIDEDLRDSLAAFSDGNGTGANHTHVYAEGSPALMTWSVGNNFCFPYATYPKYNKNTSGTWSLTEMTTPTIAAPRWINIFVAVQLALDASFQHLFIPGQNEFTSLVAAQAETWDSLDKTWLVAPEVLPIAKFTLRGHNNGWTGTGACRIESFENIYGTKNARLAVSSGSAITNLSISGALAWQTNEAYAIGQVVLYANMLWECIVSHTSSAAFLTDFGNASPRWININAKVQNRQDNTSAVRDNYAADAFPSVSNLQSATFTFASTNAIEFLLTLSTGEGILVGCDYKAATVNAISDPNGVALFTDAGVGIVVTKGANSAVITIKNRTGGAVGIGVLAIRGNISAATAWA
jgi:hypothetical protein